MSIIEWLCSPQSDGLRFATLAVVLIAYLWSGRWPWKGRSCED